MATIIPFPSARRSDAEGQQADRRFLLRTAQLLRELAVEDAGHVELLRLHTAVDLRRPRLCRVLASGRDVPDSALDALGAVSDCFVASAGEQTRTARRLAVLLEDAATVSLASET